MIAIYLIVGGVALSLALYGLHHLALYLEKRDLLYYRRKPAAGAGYNPLHELVQPNYRHVIEVGEQRMVDDDEGDDPHFLTRE